MPTLLSFLLRVLLAAVALIFAASVAVASALMLGVWGLCAGWAKLTGRPFRPFVFRGDPGGIFANMHRGAWQGSRTPRADSIRPGRRVGDVTDVEPRPPGP